jgi:hypothetical protein
VSYPPLASVGPLRAATLDGYRHLGVSKTADTGRTASTTMTSDPHLAIAVEANATYLVTLRAAIVSPAAADFQCDWTVPTSATLDYYNIHYPGGAVASPSAAFDASFSTTGGDDAVLIAGTLIVASNAGTLTWRWAQFAASGTTTVRAGSSLHLVRIA